MEKQLNHPVTPAPAGSVPVAARTDRFARFRPAFIHGPFLRALRERLRRALTKSEMCFKIEGRTNGWFIWWLVKGDYSSGERFRLRSTVDLLDDRYSTTTREIGARRREPRSTRSPRDGTRPAATRAETIIYKESFISPF